MTSYPGTVTMTESNLVVHTGPQLVARNRRNINIENLALKQRDKITEVPYVNPNSNLHSVQNNQILVAYIAGNRSIGRDLDVEKN